MLLSLEFEYVVESGWFHGSVHRSSALLPGSTESLPSIPRPIRALMTDGVSENISRLEDDNYNLKLEFDDTVR